MDDWVIWLVVAGGLLLAEIFTLTFVLGLLSVAAGVAAVAALLGAPVPLQLVVFGAAGALGFVLVRPLERLHRQRPALTTGTAALTGRRGVVTEAVTDHAGRVKLGGESWAARPLAPGTSFPVGTSVLVSKVDGATVVIYSEEM